MPIFITQGKYTQQAIKGMVAKPEDRMAAVKALVEGNGGKFIGWYMTLGEYDFLTISENADITAALSGSIAAAAGGGVSDLKTTVAFTSADAMKAFAAAGASAAKFRSAGSSS